MLTVRNTNIILFIFFTLTNLSFKILYENLNNELSLNLVFITLTTFLILICYLVSMNSVRHNENGFYANLALIYVVLVVLFYTENILVFYISFEATLIPMFLLILGWGYREEKTRAAFMFFYFTLIGGLFMLIVLMLIYSASGTFNLSVLCSTEYNYQAQKVWFLFMAFAFLVKIPVVPFHLWLPQAHVEAPLAGSILLAGILLKLGAYGLIKYSIPMFPQAFFSHSHWLQIIALISVIYGGLSTIRQSDMKRLVAYSSVAHMGFGVYALFAVPAKMGVISCVVILISHGFVSPALFMVCGVLYERYLTRIMKYYGGLINIMPLLGVSCFIFIVASIAFPGSLNFIGETICVWVSIYNSINHALLISLGAIIGLAYSLYFYEQVFTCRVSNFIGVKHQTLVKEEFLVFILLFIPVIVLGLYTNPLIKYC